MIFQKITQVILVGILLIGLGQLPMVAGEVQSEVPLTTDSTFQTGFRAPSETLMSSHWSNSSVNPLGLSNRDAMYSSSTDPTNYAKGINYYFGLPENSIIHGIEVMVEHATWNGNAGYFATIEVELQWNNRTSTTSTGTTDTVGDANSGWDDTFRNATLGGALNTWGRSWTVNDLSYDNFAVNIRLVDVYAGASESLDSAWVNVHYSIPPTPASIDISSSGDSFYTLNNVSQISLDWNISFSFGDIIDLDSSVYTYFEINGTPYLNSVDNNYRLNNSQYHLDYDTSLYNTITIDYVSSLDNYLLSEVTLNFTLVVVMSDTLAIPYLQESSSIIVTIGDESTEEPSDDVTGDPFLLFDDDHYELEIDIETLNSIQIEILPTIFNATNLNFTDFFAYVYLNNSFQFDFEWQNDTLSYFNVSRLISEVGYYEFEIIFDASSSQSSVNSSILIYLSVVESNPDDPDDTGQESTTPLNSTSIPGLSLNFPIFSVIIFLSGFIALYRRNFKIKSMD